jgi:hypothetical protein
MLPPLSSAIMRRMTSKADFTDSEWQQIVEGPPGAGMMVITAAHGGMLRETISMAKAYAEARQQHGQSELLDAVVASKPKVDHAHVHSPDELKERSLGHLRDAVALLGQKATPEELADYKSFVMKLAERVASAHSEGGAQTSAPEQAALDSIKQALG